MSDIDDDAPLIDYPAEFPITVIGKNEEGFEIFVAEILLRHFPDLDGETITSRLSRNGTYLSVRADIVAQSRDHLRTVYKELGSHKRVLMVL